jgi:SAM-dependent methyltransferase
VSATLDAQAALLRLITGHIVVSSIYVVAKLGVVDAIPSGSTADVARIAAEVGADEDALYRVLRLLAAEGLFTETSPRTFAATERGELLRDGDPSMRYLALMHGEQSMPIFTDMLEVVRTGTPVPVLRGERSRWDQLAADPEQAEIFNRAMRGRAAIRAAPLELLDWRDVEVVVDVGSGIGGVLLPLLARHEHLRGVLFDLDHVAGDARAAIGAAGLDDRCTFESGSFFERVPAGGDVYILCNILHDWPDSDSTRILQTCRAAVSESARLVLLESIVAPPGVPDQTKILDIQMLVALGGRERTEEEYRALLVRSGFELEQVAGERSAAIVAKPV